MMMQVQNTPANTVCLYLLQNIDSSNSSTPGQSSRCISTWCQDNEKIKDNKERFLELIFALWSSCLFDCVYVDGTPLVMPKWMETQ